MPFQLAARAADTGERAVPPCRHFGLCGGCQLQDLAYATQIERKRRYVRSLVSDAVTDPGEVRLHPSPPLGYRNRIRLSLQVVDGRLRAGYLRSSASSSADFALQYGTGEGPDEPLGAADAETKRTFLPITECPIAAPLLWRAAEAFLELANGAGWLLKAALMPDQLELFTTADESRLNLTLYLRTPAARDARSLPRGTEEAFASLCGELRAGVPQLSGAGIGLLPPVSPVRSRRVEVSRPGPVWGQAGLSYRVGGHGDLVYWVPRTAFFQVNRFLLPELLGAMLDASVLASGRALAWDLYAGAGLFSQPLAAQFAHITAVEIAEPAATALARMKVPNLSTAKATTLDFLRAAALQRDRPDLVVLDPPRAGAGREVCDLLGRIAAPVLVYISCSPAHLAQDVGILMGGGYALQALHVFDLFPQTTHIETVAVLTR